MDDPEKNQSQSPKKDDLVPLHSKKKVHGSGSPGSASSEGKLTSGKLVIKLKNPKSRENNAERGVNPKQQGSPLKPRICEVCKKTFINGKIFMVHIAIHHLKANKDKLPEKIQPSELKGHPVADLSALAKGGDFDSNDGKSTSSVCKKGSPLRKSLCGRMSSHPKKVSKAVKSPLLPKRSSGSSSTVSNMTQKKDDKVDSANPTAELVTDLLNYVTSWSRTDKRGRKRKASSTSLKEPANADGFLQGEVLNANKETRGEMTPMKKKKRKKKETCNMKDGNSAGDIVRADPIPKPSPAAARLSYKCNDCDKSFLTRQALGGHRSCHNKDKKSQSADESALAEDPSAAAKEVHNADITSKIDETKEGKEGGSEGEALDGGEKDGGQKSEQTGPIEAPLNEEASTGEASRTGPKILNFDLNELPPMENE
ncbi:hypothetical protein L1049_017951 [Liquidambar formosana]|uniref:C2H2-type domain-containing protein n=1 Tax=Liquidambar formosana TaxID=63359 RepID=A0AAP0NMQ0_LIQFO